MFFILVAIAPPALVPELTVFALAIVIGYYVIGNVHHALHTPLMSVTNAISGIILVGALLEIGRYGTLVTIISAVGVLLAMHQHLRRLCGDPPHALDVLEELSTG